MEHAGSLFGIVEKEDEKRSWGWEAEAVWNMHRNVSEVPRWRKRSDKCPVYLKTVDASAARAKAKS